MAIAPEIAVDPALSLAPHEQAIAGEGNAAWIVRGQSEYLADPLRIHNGESGAVEGKDEVGLAIAAHIPGCQGPGRGDEIRPRNDLILRRAQGP
jgi:hypothetical protein